MTPLARVEAAILKLETQRAGYTPIHFEAMAKYRGNPPEFAALVVTLHSTITPMLDYLRDAAERMRVEQNQAGIPIHYRHSLALADAILGDTQ